MRNRALLTAALSLTLCGWAARNAEASGISPSDFSSNDDLVIYSFTDTSTINFGGTYILTSGGTNPYALILDLSADTYETDVNFGQPADYVTGVCDPPSQYGCVPGPVSFNETSSFTAASFTFSLATPLVDGSGNPLASDALVAFSSSDGVTGGLIEVATVNPMPEPASLALLGGALLCLSLLRWRTARPRLASHT